MSGRQRSPSSNSTNALQTARSPDDEEGNVATLVSMAVVNVDIGDDENKSEKIARTQQQAEALVENACRNAVDGSGVAATVGETSKPVTIIASGNSLTQEESQTKKSKKSRSRSSKSRKARSKTSRTSRSSKGSRRKSALSRQGGRSKSEGPRSRTMRHRKSKKPQKVCRCSVIEEIENGTLSESERRDLITLLQCNEPYCHSCLELKRRLNLEKEKLDQEECDVEMDVIDVDRSASTCKRATREWKSKYKPATPPTMESMGVKFCTCPECSRYRQQGEITPMRTSAEIVAPNPSRSRSQSSKGSIHLKSPKNNWPRSSYKFKPRKNAPSTGKASKTGVSPAGSLHTTFPVTLAGKKQSGGSSGTPRKRSIPIQRSSSDKSLPRTSTPRKPAQPTTPGTKATQFYTPSATIKTPKPYQTPYQSATAPNFRSRSFSLSPRRRSTTPRKEKASTPKRPPFVVKNKRSSLRGDSKWSSWLRSTTSAPTLFPPTQTTPVQAGPRRGTQSASIATNKKTPSKSLSQTSGGSSPALPKRSSRVDPSTDSSAKTPPFDPERDYNPFCNCTNCRAYRTLREQKGLCDCDECMYEMRSGKAAGKSATSSKGHVRHTVKARYGWLKNLLSVQQPHGRYHTPQNRPVTYAWQKKEKKSEETKSDRTQSEKERTNSTRSPSQQKSPYRERSVSSSRNSTYSLSQQSQTQSAYTGSSHNTTRTKTSDLNSSTYSTSDAQLTSSRDSSYTPSSYKTDTSRSRPVRNYDNSRHHDEDPDSWSAPEEEEEGSYRTPRTRIQHHRRPWR